MSCGGRTDSSTGGQGERPRDGPHGAAGSESLKRLKTADPNLPGAECDDGRVVLSVFVGRGRFMIEQKASSLHGGESLIR